MRSVTHRDDVNSVWRHVAVYKMAAVNEVQGACDVRQQSTNQVAARRDVIAVT